VPRDHDRGLAIMLGSELDLTAKYKVYIPVPKEYAAPVLERFVNRTPHEIWCEYNADLPSSDSGKVNYKNATLNIEFSDVSTLFSGPVVSPDSFTYTVLYDCMNWYREHNNIVTSII